MKKKGIGYLLWGGLLAFLLYNQLNKEPIEGIEKISFPEFFSRIIASVAFEMKLLFILIGLILIGICYLFYKTAQKKENRVLIARLLGYLIFAISTSSILGLINTIAEKHFYSSVDNGKYYGRIFNKEWMDHLLANGNILIIIGILGILLGVGLAYILIFRKKQRTLVQEKS